MKLAQALRTLVLAAGTLVVFSNSISVYTQVPGNDRILAKFEKDVEAGKLAQSEKPLLDYALAHPNDAKALELMGRLRLKQGRIDEALALYRRALALDPQFVSAKVNYATALLLIGQSDEAVRLLNGIDPSGIKDLITQLNLAQAHVLAGNCPQALAVVAALPAAVVNTDALPIRATCYVQLGKTNDLDALVPLAKKAVTASPNAVMRFAGVMIDAGRSRAALEVLQLISRSMPTNSKALTLQGRAEIMEKDFAAAQQYLGRAAALEADSPEVAYLQAQLEIEQGNVAAAVPFLKKALQLAPNSPDILARLALTAIKANQPRDAVEAAEKLLALKPDDPDGLYLLGAAALQSGDLQKAQSNLERYALIRPNDSRGCVALGLTLAAQRDQIEPARQQLRHCLEIDPANIEAKYQIGLSYKAQGDTAQAIRFLEQTVTAAPRYALALRDLGTVYLQAGDEPKAREMLERSVAIDPNDAETHFQLSRLYNLIGEAGLAKQHLDLFQKIKNRRGQ
jgi:tetratricopeptide (TPR) repeat protein